MKRRDQLVDAFSELGMSVAIPDGSYFFIVQLPDLMIKLPEHPSEECSGPSIMEPHDYAICRWMTTELGITAIPPSAFYDQENKHTSANWIRICFCKSDETISKAYDRLQNIIKFVKK